MGQATVYPYGQTVRAVATIWASATPEPLPINPASCIFLARNPLGSVASWGFGVASISGSPGIVKVATGAFILDHLASVQGEWHTVWEAPLDSGLSLWVRQEESFVVAMNRVI